MLSFSGEDPVTIPRKNIGNWNGQLGVRFVLQANEAPWLHDTTQALLSRLVVIPHRVTFEGREDVALTDTLCAELPGIFLWALQGLGLVREAVAAKRPALLRPERGEEERAEIAHLINPLAQFIAEECVIDGGELRTEVRPARLSQDVVGAARHHDGTTTGEPAYNPASAAHWSNEV